MNVQTTRFGCVEIDADRVITFPMGMLGFANFHRFALLQPNDEGIFFWLQSLDAPELAFVVTDPTLWVSDYQATIRREQMEQLELESLDGSQILVIVNKYERSLTANLQGPLVINTSNRQAMQLVLADKRWMTRQEIVDLGEPLQAVSA